MPRKPLDRARAGHSSALRNARQEVPHPTRKVCPIDGGAGVERRMTAAVVYASQTKASSATDLSGRCSIDNRTDLEANTMTDDNKGLTAWRAAFESLIAAGQQPTWRANPPRFVVKRALLALVVPRSFSSPNAPAPGRPGATSLYRATCSNNLRIGTCSRTSSATSRTVTTPVTWQPPSGWLAWASCWRRSDPPGGCGPRNRPDPVLMRGRAYDRTVLAAFRIRGGPFRSSTHRRRRPSKASRSMREKSTAYLQRSAQLRIEALAKRRPKAAPVG